MGKSGPSVVPVAAPLSPRPRRVPPLKPAVSSGEDGLQPREARTLGSQRWLARQARREAEVGGKVQ